VFRKEKWRIVGAFFAGSVPRGSLKDPHLRRPT
jgi:hypothetical protein